MIRIGVLGAGHHSASSHGAALAELKAQQPARIELAAVCDLDRAKAEAYAARFGFARVYTDLDAMLRAERLDGLAAITAVRQTEELVSRLLPRGIALVIEKPPGATREAARRLADLAGQTRTPHMVSFNRRFTPALVKAQEWLRGPAAGRPPRLIAARMLRHARREPDFASSTGIHLVDATLALAPGRPTALAVTRLATAAPGCFDYLARLDFGSGASASLLIAPACSRVEETYELHGEDYTVSIDTLQCRCRIVDADREVLAWEVPPDASAAFRSGSLGETEAFVNALEGKAPFAPTLEDGALSLQIAESIEREAALAFA